jgi:hypothetical protein
MRRMPRFVSLCALTIASGLWPAPFPARGDDPPAADRQIPDPSGDQAQAPIPAELPPHILNIQRSMGGSLLEQFDALQPAQAVDAPWWRQFQAKPAPAASRSPGWPDPSAAAAPPGMWPNWSPRGNAPIVVPAIAEAPAAGLPTPVSTLRTTAAELDTAANRLEELELYPQSDALRELAQRFRIDARRMAASRGRFEAPWIRPTDPDPRQPARRTPGPAPDLAPTPPEPAIPAESPSDSGDTGPDAWNATSPQVPTPAQ